MDLKLNPPEEAGWTEPVLKLLSGVYGNHGLAAST